MPDANKYIKSYSFPLGSGKIELFNDAIYAR